MWKKSICRSTIDAFARKAAKAENYHGRKPTARELRDIFRLEAERRISNDWVIRHQGRYLQLQPAGQGAMDSRKARLWYVNGRMEVGRCPTGGSAMHTKSLPTRCTEDA